MTLLLDGKVLMARLWQNHEHHDVARRWFRDVKKFATCPVAQLGFARVSSHAGLGYGMSPDEAFSLLRQLLADSRHRFVPDDLSCADRVVRTELDVSRQSSDGPLSGRVGSAVQRFSLHRSPIVLKRHAVPNKKSAFEVKESRRCPFVGTRVRVSLP